MKLKPFFLFIPLLALQCCTQPEVSSETDDAVMDEAPMAPDEVSFTSTQMQTVGIKIGKAENKALSNSVKVNGMLTVPNENKAFVTPLYAGVVRSLSVHPGKKVAKGQVLATIVNPDLMQMQQQVQSLNAQIKMAELEVARQKQLVEGNAAPLKRLQQAETELTTLRSERTGLQKQLGGVGAAQTYSGTIAVRAPISGTVSKVIAQIGSSVNMASPIAEIVNNNQLHLDIFAYEKDLPKIRLGQTIHFTQTNNPGAEYDAEIYSIGSAFEGESRTVPVHARVTGNKVGLIDGMNVTAIVSLDTLIGMAVPDDALVNEGGQDFVFVVRSQNDSVTTFKKIPVARGYAELGYTQITPLKSFPADAGIVVQHAFFVLAKMNGVEEEEE